MNDISTKQPRRPAFECASALSGGESQSIGSPSARPALALLILVAFLLGATAIFPPALADQQTESSNETCMIAERTVGKKTFEIASLVVNASPDRVYTVLTDYQNAVRIFPGLKMCQVVESHGVSKCVSYKIEPGGSLGALEYQVEVRETRPGLIEWHRVGGCLREMEGSWKLEPANGGRSTIVTYAAHVNVGLFIPQFVTNRHVRAGMPGIMNALKTQAEGTAVIAEGLPAALRN